MAGYSGTPLQQKLGAKPGWKVAVVGRAPAGLFDDFDGVVWRKQLRPPLDGTLVFVTSQAELVDRGGAAIRPIIPDGSVWIAWPKQSSDVATDRPGQAIRDLLVDERVVDDKVCAVDDTLAGLRLVYRRTVRRPAPR